MTDRPTCDTCRAFAPTPPDGTAPAADAGQCRRRAPLGHSLQGVNVVPYHPMVPAAHWCGEHEPIKAGEPAKPRTKSNG